MATEYVVLRQVTHVRDAHGDLMDADTDLYEAVDVRTANEAEQAIRLVRDARDAPEEDTTESWHAVPLSRWTSLDAATEVPPPKTTYKPGKLPGGAERVAREPSPAPVDDGPTDPEA